MALWKGRFRAPLDPAALKFSTSLGVDKRLYREDIQGSLAHVAMLAKQRIISRAEAAKIQKALREIARELSSGTFSLSTNSGGKKRFVAEDIHMAIENRLTQKIGAIGGKLHTARSRNDQIALDERLYLRNTPIVAAIRKLQSACVAKARQYESVIMPGYTHLQRAQPVLLTHHLLAYVSMLERDRERFADCLKRANRSPLGAGALAGTSFPIDRKYTARLLNFDSLVENSIDAVSDRDVLIEFVSACSITMMHLSRFAEELVLWSSEEWAFAEIGEAYTTGSSIMPQKKNPDMAELIRGKTGRVYGDLIALLTIMKGLPLSYNRDMQEDKEPLFDAADTLAGCLHIFAKMFRSVKFDRRRFEREPDFMLATELADYLARKKMPFRKAHTIAGSIVRQCIQQNLSLKDLPLEEYRKHSPLFANDVYRLLDLRNSLAAKQSEGSTSPKQVHRALQSWSKKLR